MTSAAPRPWDKWRRGEELRFDPNHAARFSSIPQLAAISAERFGDRPCFSLVLPNGATATLSYAALDAKATAFAKFLSGALGLRRGDVVAIQAPNCLAYPVALIGALRAGAVVSNVNPLYTAFETKRQLADCGAKVLVGFDMFGAMIDEVAAETPGLRCVVASVADFFPQPRRALLKFALRHIRRNVPPLRTAATPLAQAIAFGETNDVDVTSLALEGAATCFYQYSGGTTGEPKGVELSSRGLLTNIEQVVCMSPDTLRKPGLTVMLVLPLYHMFGLYVAATAMQGGGHVALTPSPRPLSNLKPAFDTFAPQVFPGVNSLFAALLEEPWFQRDPPTSIEVTLSGATALSPSVADRWRRATGSVIAESYGMTEATTVLTTNPLDDRNRAGTAGLPPPGVDLRIIDTKGEPLPLGEVGEIVARGPQLMSGYLGRPEATSAAFIDGWLRTGDVGRLDEDGYLHVVDRLKDMLIVSGFNVYPQEIEAVIAAVPGVAEVGVVGRAVPDKGDEIAAFIVRSDPNLDQATIHAACADRLTGYKMPKDIRFVSELPKSPIGKVLRRKLRETLE
ncbi:MAG: AMP-binding protein [Pseudomonadota bacterium]